MTSSRSIKRLNIKVTKYALPLLERWPLVGVSTLKELISSPCASHIWIPIVQNVSEVTCRPQRQCGQVKALVLCSASGKLLPPGIIKPTLTQAGYFYQGTASQWCISY